MRRLVLLHETAKNKGSSLACVGKTTMQKSF